MYLEKILTIGLQTKHKYNVTTTYEKFVMD